MRVQGQNTLAEELRVPMSRTTSRMEVHEMEVAPPLRLFSWIATLKQELNQTAAYADRRTTDMDRMC